MLSIAVWAQPLSYSGVLQKLLQTASHVCWGVLCRGKANIERPVLSFWEDANRMQAEEEEKHLVSEFAERLKYNLQQVHALQLACTHTAWAII